jgi:hypothetical protein
MSAKALRINARLGPRLARRVSAVQARTKKSLTTIVTESLESYCDRLDAVSSPLAGLEAAGFVGSGEGPRDLSVNFRREFGRSLSRKIK